MTRGCATLALALACLAVAQMARPSVARVSSVTVSPDGRNVYGLANGKRVRLLRGCAREVFFGATGDSAAPNVSPDGRWIVLERLWPYEQHGRVDESTVLFDTSNGRSYASSYYGSLFAAGTPITTTWVRGHPARLEIEGADAKRRVDLPGALAQRAPPDRCPLR